MKNEEYKKCQLKNLQKQQEDMKVAMLEIGRAHV